MGQDRQVGQGETADMKIGTNGESSVFDAIQAKDIRNERRVLWSEIGVAFFLALLVAGYLIVA